ncbi:MAG: glycosyltransferase [Thermoleophilia bacterium]
MGDFAHFSPAADRSLAAAEARDLPRPVLGFHGNFLGSKVDLGLLRGLAERLPQATLLLVGPARDETDAELQALAALPNVHWVGGKPYEELPAYVAAFDVGLIPYVANAYTRNVFPLKLYEYLAAAKPVVATGVPELAGREPDVLLVEGIDAAVAAVEAQLARDAPEDRARRTAIAAANTWEARTERLLGLVAEALEARR